ncbi:hypothetical protein AAMO2058_000347400 [Amorphochlora amoebiformis]
MASKLSLADELLKSVTGATTAYILDHKGTVLEASSGTQIGDVKGKAELVMELLRSVGGLLKIGGLAGDQLRKITVNAGKKVYKVSMDSLRIYVVECSADSKS